MTSLDACRLEGIKPEAKVIADMKICYPDVFEDLNLAKFNALIHALKASNEDYEGSTIVEYYCMLKAGTLQDLFVKSFFKVLK